MKLKRVVGNIVVGVLQVLLYSDALNLCPLVDMEDRKENTERQCASSRPTMSPCERSSYKV